MSADPTNDDEVKLLPPAAGESGRPAAPNPAAATATTTTARAIAVPTTGASVTVATTPARQLAALPKDELAHLAEEYGLEARGFKTPQDLVSAIHARRQLIAAMDRDAMLDVVRWGRRPVPINATGEQLAHEIFRIRSMRFDGLSERGLLALARLRGVDCDADQGVPALVKRLKKKEGFFSRLNRKRRAILGSIVSNMIGEEGKAAEYQFLPAAERDGSERASSGGGGGGGPSAASAAAAASRDRSIKEEIEESGLFGGIASRVKKTADQYINQKLDEIESRIDRKLDEIDRRLAEWRDKEIANRIRILKITLWASVIVAVVSLIYMYVKVNLVEKREPPAPKPAEIRKAG